MDLDIGRLVLTAAIIFSADVLLSEAGRLEHGKSEEYSRPFRCFFAISYVILEKSYCNYRREEN